jgi:hypothetical protein
LELRDGFEAWLFGRSKTKEYFWGDLDWAGMRILAALRSSFPETEAWEPGYRLMLELLQAGHGHSPDAADKAGQRATELTGCGFADRELLLALRTFERFVDQEAVTL